MKRREVEVLTATTEAGNISSMNVLWKCGFRETRTFLHENGAWRVDFVVERPPAVYATVCIVCSSKVDFKNAASQNLGELCHVFQLKAKLGRGILNNSKAKHGPESRKVRIMPSLRKQTNVPLEALLSRPTRTNA